MSQARDELARRASEPSPGARERGPKGEDAPRLTADDEALLDEAAAAVNAGVDDLVGGSPLAEQ